MTSSKCYKILYNAKAAGHFYVNSCKILVQFYVSKEYLDVVLKGIFEHNTKETNGLLKKPAIDINIYLKDGEKTIGDILCDTFNFCIYIEVMWIYKDYKEKGLGKELNQKRRK